MLVHPWNRHDLGLPDFADEERVWGSHLSPEFYHGHQFYVGKHGLVDANSDPQAMKLLLRLGYPFGALVLAQQRGGEHRIVVQVKNRNMMDVLEIS